VIDPVEYANENKQRDPVKLFDGVKIIVRQASLVLLSG
jgi:Fe-S cluster assembly iron-binding protein IscA